MEIYRTHPDPWRTGYNSVDNMILGHYSKKQAVTMVENSGNDYQYIIFIRPDCLYLHELKLDFLKKANNKTVVTPDFNLYGHAGHTAMNDSFAITTMSTYKIYGCIFDRLLAISKYMRLHSETVLAHVLKQNGINNITIPFRFRRIRNDGRVCDRDKEII
jgi:hypothetical protein